MAGLSQRFLNAGYSAPKYMLHARGQSIFGHAVGGFAAYFKSCEFMFIVRDIAQTPAFVQSECSRLGIKQYRVIIIPSATSGQAETVAIGLRLAHINGDTPLTIFNIDTFRRNFLTPHNLDLKSIAGYLEVFRGTGNNWSYVAPHATCSGRVAFTTEKVPVSDLCCTGLYYFSSANLYLQVFDEYSRCAADKMGLSELYVAPMYNLLIEDKREVLYHEIERSEVVFCGTPTEYQDFVSAH